MELVVADITPHAAAGRPAVDVEQNDSLQLGELLQDAIKVELERRRRGGGEEGEGRGGEGEGREGGREGGRVKGGGGEGREGGGGGVGGGKGEGEGNLACWITNYFFCTKKKHSGV